MWFRSLVRHRMVGLIIIAGDHRKLESGRCSRFVSTRVIETRPVARSLDRDALTDPGRMLGRNSLEPLCTNLPVDPPSLEQQGFNLTSRPINTQVFSQCT